MTGVRWAAHRDDISVKIRDNPLLFPRYRGTETHKMIILSQTKHLTIDSLFYAENGFLRQFYVKELNDFKFCRMSYHKVIEEI